MKGGESRGWDNRDETMCIASSRFRHMFSRKRAVVDMLQFTTNYVGILKIQPE